MIKEDYVNSEIAKLLKDKGFDEPIPCFYRFDSKELYRGAIATNTQIGNKFYNAPTLQMTVKWLRKEYNILLVVDYEYECDTTPYFFKIYRLDKNGKPKPVAVKGISYDKDNNQIEHIIGYRDWERSEGDYSTFEEACKMGIKYCLENLI